jgi:hypothetical protein
MCERVRVCACECVFVMVPVLVAAVLRLDPMSKRIRLLAHWHGLFALLRHEEEGRSLACCVAESSEGGG